RPGRRPCSVDFDAESPYILVNTSTGAGKSVTLRYIAPILSRSPTLGSLRQGQALPGAPRGDDGRSIMEASRASASASALVGGRRGGLDVEVAVVHGAAGGNDLVDAVKKFVRELDIGPGEGVGQVLGAAWADQHRGEGGVGADERGGQMGQRQPRFARQRGEL